MTDRTDLHPGPGAVTSGGAVAPDPLDSAEPVKAHRSLAKDVWIQFRSHKGAVVGTVVFLFIVLGVAFGPFFFTVDPTYIDFRAKNTQHIFACLFWAPPTPAEAAGEAAAGIGGWLASIPEWFVRTGWCVTDPKGFGEAHNGLLKVDWAHPLGTDNYGRDVLAQLMAGGRVSLAVGVTAMLLSIVLGALIGVMAGFFKWLDGPLMRLTDLFLALPILPLLLVMIMLFRDALRAAFGPEEGIFILVVAAIGITSWMQTARIVRGDVLSIKEREFVLAARSIGTRQHRIIGRHIFPNVLSPIMVSATLGLATAIITESALSFLGLGFPSDFPTWGRLLIDGRDFMDITPSRVIWPGLAISLTVLSVNYIGDGLRDALDPRQRG